MSTSRKPLTAIVGVTSNEVRIPNHDQISVYVEQFLDAFCNLDERYVCSSTISCQPDESSLPISWSISSCIAAIHETGYMNNALNGEGKMILLYTNTA